MKPVKFLCTLFS